MRNDALPIEQSADVGVTGRVRVLREYLRGDDEFDGSGQDDKNNGAGSAKG